MPFTIGSQPPALPPGSLILVTGANSFVGSHICDQLLQLGYHVRGTVRSVSRSTWLLSHFHSLYPPSHFTLIEAPTLTSSSTWTSLLASVSGVAHVANIDISGLLSTSPTLITDSITNSLIAVDAAIASHTVKRFVSTSSSAAVYVASSKSKTPRTITPQDWNVGAVTRAWSGAGEMGDFYAAAKVQADFAVLERTREVEREMVFVTVHPDTCVGESLGPTATSSGGVVREAWEGRDVGRLGGLAKGGYRWWVNVRDAARLHVSALLDADVRNGERILGYAGKQSGRIWREEFLKLQRELGEEEEGIGMPIEEDFDCIDEVDNTRSTELLRRLGRDGWVSLEQSIRENVGVLKQGVVGEK